MSFPSTYLLEYLRSDEEDGLLDRCEVLRRDVTEDRGVEVDVDPNNVWPEVDDDVPVRVDPYYLSPRDVQSGTVITVEGSFNAVFVAGYDIRNKDRIKVTTLDNRIFQMVGPRYASNETARIMACTEIT